MHSLLYTILPVFPLIYPAIFFFFFLLSLELYVCVYTYVFFFQPGRREGGLDPCLGKIPWRRPGIPLQYSCLENPVNRGAWQSIDFRVAQSHTQLKQLSSSSRYADDTTLMAESEEELKILLMKVKRRVKKLP